MVMCGAGSPERDKGTYYRATLVYFPSQDAISPSVFRGCGGGVAMWTSSTKRKREEEEQTYFTQRQSILDISMIKLRTQPLRRTEQPLRRSVLIFNTLKTIESELTLEGVRWNLPHRPSLLPSIQPNDLTLDPIPANNGTDSRCSMERGLLLPGGATDRHLSMDTTCRSPLATSKSVSVTATTNDSVVPSGGPVTPSGPETSSSYTDTHSILDSWFSLPVSQTGPLPTFSSLLDLDTSTTSQVVDSVGSTGYTATTPPPASTPSTSPHLPAPSSSSSSPCHQTQHSVSRSSSSSSSSAITTSSYHHHHHHPVSSHGPLVATAEHDPLTDFDISSLDLDFFSFLPSNLKLPPLSAEDLQSLPHPETFSQTRPTSCNPKHSDLLGDDLDSIMQILVGI